MTFHVLVVLGILSGAVWGTRAGQSDQVATEPALRNFHRAVADYLALRAKIAEEIAPLAPNSTAAQVSATSDALARAVQRARPKPRPGTFFDTSAAGVIKARLRDLLARNPMLLDGIADENAPKRAPGVYARFPGASPLATMPPSLLAALPPLPPELEYRLVENDLVLRDIAAGLILDVLPKAAVRP